MLDQHLAHTMVADHRRALLAAGHSSRLVRQQHTPRPRHSLAAPASRWLASFAAGCRSLAVAGPAHSRHERLVRWH